MNNKIFMWTTCRCLSTVIERPFIENDNIKVIHEPFSNVFYLGPEKTSNRYNYEEQYVEMTYEKTSNELQNMTHTGPIFIKDMAYNIKKQYNLINKGFVHTFLIRNPLKVAISLNKLITNTSQPELQFFESEEMSFEAIYYLHKYVTEELNQASIIIDADDVLNDPKKILSEYCKKVGINFNDNMLQWEYGKVPNESWLYWKGWHDDAINCTCFRKPTNCDKTINDLPAEMQECVIKQLPFYEKLFELRLR